METTSKYKNISETTYWIFLKLKLKLMGPNQNKSYLKLQRPQMEEDLKLKVRGLSQNLKNLPMKTTSNGR